MQKLNGKVALITGGSSGIGLATAKLFQEEGAKVIITGRSAKTLDEARAVLGPDAEIVQSDTANLADIDALATRIQAKFGGLDVVFVNAGIAQFAPVEQASEEFYDRMFNTNVRGAFFLIQKTLPLLREGGSILLNASGVQSKGMAAASVYAATKAAVRSLGRSLAAELAPRGIRVNTISPGPITTPIYAKLGMGDDTTKQFEEYIASQNPMKRFGTPDEVAKTALFLAADATFITGEEVNVDGGWTRV
jgi:NAD(P)-dependent dehydrogenase (short-subunit alcohol dehydrogenase family)